MAEGKRQPTAPRYLSLAGLAVQRGHPELARYLFDHGASPTSVLDELQLDLSRGKVEKLWEFLAGAGFSPDSRLGNGETLLTQAAQYGSRWRVDLFLAEGSDPSIPNAEGKLPADIGPGLFLD